jgi:hypothetical protein
MPTAGDGDNLKHNLDVLASLEMAQTGTKLSYDGTTGRFSVQAPGLMQTLARTFSSDSVTSREYFSAPMTALFAAALARIGTGASREQFEAAFRGLKRLQLTYASQPDKLQALERVISAIKQQLDRALQQQEEKQQEDSARKVYYARPGNFAAWLYGKYAKFLIAKIQQDEQISTKSSGVCFGYSLDWLSRKTHTQRAKASYLVSKHHPKRPGPGDLLKDLGASPDLDPKRMAAKIKKGIQPLQDVYEAYRISQYRMNTFLPGAIAQSFPASDTKRRGYYAGLKIELRAEGPRGVRVQIGEDAPLDEGKRVFREILERCVPKKSNDQMVEQLQKSIKEYKGKPGCDKIVEMWEKTLKELGAEARNILDPNALPFLLFLDPIVTEKNKTETNSDGHAVALYIDAGRYHFFDPNFGEFEFPRAAQENFLSFANDLWLFYRIRAHFNSWTLYDVYY